jgi:hypothetical protein
VSEGIAKEFEAMDGEDEEDEVVVVELSASVGSSGDRAGVEEEEAAVAVIEPLCISNS